MAVSTGTHIYQKLDFLEVGVRLAGTSNAFNMVGDILDFTFEHKDGEPFDWTLTLDNTTGKYSPFLTVSDPRYDALITPKIEPVKAYEWMFHAKTSCEDPAIVEEYTYYKLTAIRVNYGVSATGGYVVYINGTDNSWLLFQENQTMPTWRSVIGGVIMAKVIIGDICTKFGITVEYFGSGTCQFQDYPVRWCHMQGEIPIDIIKQIIGVKWAKWRIDPLSGNLVIYNSPEGGQDSAPPEWTLNDKDTIESLSYSKERWNVCTEVVVRRTEETSGICFEEEGGATTAGLHTLDFDTGQFPDGASYVNISAICVGGTFDTGVFPNRVTTITLYSGAGGTGAAVSYGGGGSPGPYKSVSFSFEYTIPANPAVVPYYHIIGRGSKYDPNPIWGIPNPLFASRWRNTTLYAWIGEHRPAKDPIINTLIPDDISCQGYAQAFLRESASKFEVISGVIGFHMLMKQGDKLIINEYGSNFVNRVFHIMSVSQSLTAGTTNITACHYRTGDVITSVPLTDP